MPNDDKKNKTAIIPIPEKAQKELGAFVKNNKNRQLHGAPEKIYKYLNYDSQWIFCTCLYDKTTGKLTSKGPGSKTQEKYVPYYYSDSGWIEGRPDVEHLPLFHEEKLKGNDLPVLAVSNEKLASIKVDGYILVAPTNGIAGIINSIEYLKSHRVILWPGNNPRISTIKTFLPEAEILDLKGKSKSWSIQSAINKNIDVAKFIKECPRVKKGADLTKLYTAHDTFHIIRKEIYGDDNLEQLDGIFYVYDENKHFWKARNEVTIKSDIQKWIEMNYIKTLKKNDTRIHTYVANVKSFLSNWSRKYYITNPFKESVLQPYIHLKNGVIELSDKGFKFHARDEKGEKYFKDLYPLHCLDFDFELKYYKETNLQDHAPAFYYYLKSLIPKYIQQDKEKYEKELSLTIDFFGQIIAYCISPLKMSPAFFAMYGGQNTGKSFFVELLETIIGEEFFVTRKIRDMENRFAAADLWGSKVFVDDDVKSNITLPDDFIKNYTGQKSITIEKKNKDSINGVKISVAMFFISNHAFTVTGGVEGIERRMIYIPYRETIKNPDKHLKKKIIGQYKKGQESGKYFAKQFDERPAIIGLALRGIDLFVKNNYEFVMPEWISKERSEWIIQSNSITQFLYEVVYPGEKSKWSRKDIYDEYKDWCKEEDRHMYGRNNFYEKLRLEQRIKSNHTYDGDEFIIELDNPESERWNLDDLPI